MGLTEFGMLGFWEVGTPQFLPKFPLGKVTDPNIWDLGGGPELQNLGFMLPENLGFYLWYPNKEEFSKGV